MKSFILLVVYVYLSLIMFSFLFSKLNDDKFELFKSIQTKTNNFGEEKRRKVKRNFNILIVVIAFILPIFNLSDIISGFIIGFLFALIDICLSENPIENDWKNGNELEEY